MNGSKTGITTFSRKNKEQLNESETLIVGTTSVKKSDMCIYFVVTTEKHLGFQTQVKKVLKIMADGIKTIETVQHTFLTTVSLMLTHTFVRGNLDYSALCLHEITSSRILSMEKHKLGCEMCFLVLVLSPRFT